MARTSKPKETDSVLDLNKSAKETAEVETKQSLELRLVTQDFAITSQDDLQFASDMLADVKKRARDLESKKKEATDPINKALGAIRSWFKPALDAYASIEVDLKSKISAYLHQQEEEKMRLLAAAGEQSGEDARATMMELASRSGEVAGVQARKIWSVEVVDAALVPREFMKVDESALLAHARETGGEEVPGVRFFQKTSIASVG